MNFQQVRHTIDYIVQRVRTGRLALPDFQRDFVWSPAQVVELLDSVAKQWPIGSLLLLSGPQPFAFRAIDSGPGTEGDELDLYILDGQQRVTALYHAVMDVSSFCYFVDFNALNGDEQEVIGWERRDKFEKRFPSLRDRAAVGIALIKDLWDHSAFFSWLNETQPEVPRDVYVRLREERLAGLQSKVYHIMAIELEQAIDMAALARIFETINRTGIPLNAFDLLVAKLYPTKFNLREEWNCANESHDIIARFKPDEIEVLKLVSLLIRKHVGRKHSRGVRQGDLLSLEPDLIIRYWRPAVDLYARALHECGRFGVVHRDLVPSWAMVLGVAGCLDEGTGKKMSAWWKDRLVRQTFAQAANTKIVSEFDMGMEIDAQRGSDDDFDPAAFLNRPARANGLFTRGLLGLVIANGGRDPVTGLLLSSADEIVLRSITPDGALVKLTADSPINGVIALAETSSKKIKNVKEGEASVGGQALRTQGIDESTLARTAEFTRRIFLDGA